MKEKGLLKTECLPDHFFFLKKKVGNFFIYDPIHARLCDNYKL